MLLAGSHSVAATGSDRVHPRVAEAYLVEQFDHGWLEEGVTIDHTFRFGNSGEAPLFLLSAQSTCACATVEHFTEAVDHAGEGRIAVKIRPQGVGQADVRFVFETSDPDFPVIAFRWTARVTDSARAPLAGLEENRVDPADLMKGRWLREREAGRALLIDVRDSARFERAYIPRARRVALDSIKTQRYLRSRRLLLLGFGHDDSPLMAEAARLNRSGWDVHVVAGGLRGWQRAGGPVSGSDARSAAALAELSAAEFYGSHGAGWQVVHVRSPDEAAPSWLSAGMVVLYNGHPPSFWTALSEQLSRNRAETEAVARRLLVVSTDGAYYEALERALADAPRLPVFYLAGGVRAYGDQVSRQIAFESRSVATVSNQHNALQSPGSPTVYSRRTNCLPCQ